MRINVHAHVFNLRTMLTDRSLDIVERRIRDEVEPELLGEAAAGLAAEVLKQGGDFDEEAALRKILGQLKEESGIGELIDRADFVPPAVRELLAESLEEKGLSFLRRAADSLVGVFRRDKDDDITSKSIYNSLDLLRLVSRPTVREVADRLMNQLGTDEGAVLLALDITGDAAERQGKDGKPGAVFAEQTRQTADLILPFPGRVFPFYGLHPGRPDPRGRLEEAVKQGYVGVKIYPSTTGWQVSDPAMDGVYAYCLEQGLPLLMHCNQQGFYRDEADTRQADPALWRPILDRFPGLRICFAHFGGGGGTAKPEIPEGHWAQVILDLMKEYPGVYTDVSSHSAPMKNDETRETYFGNLKKLLNAAETGDRILFGTDFWLMRVRLTEARHWRFFRENLTELQFEKMAETNTARFLGLPRRDEAGLLARPNRAFESYAARIVAALEDPKLRDELRGPMPAWLLELVAALDTSGGGADRAALEAWGTRFEPSPTLTIPGWRGIVDRFAGKALERGEGVVFDPVRDASAVTQLGGATIGVSAGGSFGVRLFTDEDQRDPDGVLLPRPGVELPAEAQTEDPDDGKLSPLALAPQIPFAELADENAWIAYRLTGQLHLQARGALSSVGLHVEAGTEVVLTDYRMHERGSGVTGAVRGDLTHPRFALDLGDVLRLEGGEAVSFTSRGRLSARASASFAHLLTGGLGSLSQALGVPAQVLGVKADLSARVSARLSFTDDFQVVFSRKPQKDNRGRDVGVALLKRDSRQLAVEVAADVQIAWENPQALRKLLSGLVGAALGEAPEKLESLLDATDTGKLSSAEKKVLEAVVKRFDLDGLTEAREKIIELRDKAKAALDKLAATRLEAGFRYEYTRTRTGSLLLEALITEDALVDFHDELVDGDVDRLVEQAGLDDPDAEAVKLTSYVVETRRDSRSAWGFRLGSSIAGRDVKEKSLVVQEARIPRADEGPGGPAGASGVTGKRVAFRGARSYSGAWPELKGRQEWSWRMDFSAEMPGFRSSGAAGEPTLSDFRYGLAFLYDWTFGKLRDEHLGPCLDAARLWGALPDGAGSEEALAEARELLAPLLGQKVELRLSLLFDHRALQGLLPLGEASLANAAPTLPDLAEALAAAMPYRDDPVRSSSASRRAAYAGLWREAMSEVDADFQGSLPVHARRELAGKYADLVAARLQGDHPGEAREERNEVIWTKNRWTLGGMLNLTPFPLAPWRGAVRSLARLTGAVRKTSTADYTALPDLHRPLDKLASQSHWVRTFGRYLLTEARKQGAADRVEAVLTAEPVGGGEGVVLGGG